LYVAVSLDASLLTELLYVRVEVFFEPVLLPELKYSVDDEAEPVGFKVYVFLYKTSS
jgi:hypothetical protein